MSNPQTSTPTTAPATWEQLLHDAVTKPGTLNAAYSAFHHFSSGNQMLAMWQCMMRGIDAGPIGTYQTWKDKGRQVRKGEKAITLCMPRTMKVTDKNADEDADPTRVITRFIYRPNWFVLSQTDGEDAEPEPVPGFDPDKAMQALQFSRVPFTSTDGNTQGYCIPNKRTIAINPVAVDPFKTLMHEMGHCLLHADDADHADALNLPRSLKEVEAESIALIVTASLNLPGADYCRGYIQNWYGTGNAIPDANARRIFHAADQILKAGKTVNIEAEIARLKRENAKLAARVNS